MNDGQLFLTEEMLYAVPLVLSIKIGYAYADSITKPAALSQLPRPTVQIQWRSCLLFF